MIRVWAHSPVSVLADALAALVVSLGFESTATPDGADVALVDLAAYDDRVPAAPRLPAVAILSPATADAAGIVQRAGYRGYVRSSDPKERLRAEIVAASVPLAFADDARQGHAEAHPPLTPREAQVLGLLMLGLPNKRIASRLGITERTIKHHVSSLIRKYHARGRLGLLVKSQGASRS